MMVLSETIHAMLLTHDKFRQFTPKKIADARTCSEVLICISADSRDAVDEVLAKAEAAMKGRINHSVCKWCYPKIALEDLCVVSAISAFTGKPVHPQAPVAPVRGGYNSRV